MGVVANLCENALLFDKGSLRLRSESRSCIRAYLESEACGEVTLPSKSGDIFQFKTIKLMNGTGKTCTTFASHEHIDIEVSYYCKHSVKSPELSVRIETADGTSVFTTNRSDSLAGKIQEGHARCVITIPGSFLCPGAYAVTIGSHFPNESVISVCENIVSFKIEEAGTKFAKYRGANFGIVFCDCDWREISE